MCIAPHEVDWAAQAEALGDGDDEDVLGQDEGQLPGSQASAEDHSPREMAIQDGVDDVAIVDPPETHLCRLALQLSDDRLVGDAHAAGVHYTKDKLHIGSLTAEAAFLKIDRNALREHRVLSAGLVAELERQAWARVEDYIVAQKGQPGVRLRVHLEAYMYDGVDLTLKTRRKADLGSSFEVPLDPDEDDEDRLRVRDEIIEHLWSLPETTEDGPAKLLNSQHGVAMLVTMGETHHVLQGEVVTWVQCMDRYTGETLKQALRKLCMSTEDGPMAFERRIRLSITDAAGYNTRAEKYSGQPGAAKLHFLCDTHVLAGLHTKTFNLLSGPVDGMIKTSLCLQGAGTMGFFRRSLRKVLAEKLVLIREEPPDDAKEHTRAMLDLYLGSDMQHAVLRATLSRLASGDWRKKDRFEFLVTGRETKSEVYRMLCEFLVPALVGHAPRTFPRHRWTGAELAVADLGLLAVVHDLLGATFKDWIACYGGTVDDAGGPAGMGLEAEGSRAQGAAVGNAADPRSAEAKRAYRGVALAWVKGRDRDRDLAVVKRIMEPMSTYMVKEIAGASALAESEATMKRLQAALGEGDLNGFLQSGRWPVLEAALCTKDKDCLDRVAALHEPEVYRGWLPKWICVETSAMLFKALSRQGAGVHQLLHTKHKACPYQVFRLVQDATAARDLLDSCPSSLDEFAESFLKAHRGDLTSEAAKLELAMVLIHGRTSTVSLESSNATLRRRLYGMSLQVVAPELHAVSAEFSLGKLRRRQLDIRFPPGSRERKAKTRRRPELAKPKKRKGKTQGGPAAFWVYMNDKKQRVSSELWQEFHALSPAEKEALAERGGFIADKHRLGMRGFAPRDRVPS